MLIGGNIESSGVSIKIASQRESKWPTGPGVVVGMDLELGVSGGDHFIDCGFGWIETQSSEGCKQIHFANSSFFPSGAGRVVCGIELANSSAVSMGTNTIGGLKASPLLAIVLLQGNANSGFTILGPPDVSSAQALVSINGAIDKWGSLSAPYYYEDGHASTPSFAIPIKANSCVALPPVNIGGANPGMACSVAPTLDPGPQFTWSCFIQSGNSAQARLCNVTSMDATPQSTEYNVVVTH